MVERAEHQGVSEASAVIARSIAAPIARDSAALGEVIEMYRRHAEAGDASAQANYIEIVDSAPAAALRDDAAALQRAARFVDDLAQQGNAQAQWRQARSQPIAGQGPAHTGAMAASAARHAGVVSRPPIAFAPGADACIESLLAEGRMVAPEQAALLFEFHRARGWADTLARDALIAAAEAGLSAAQFALGCLQVDTSQLEPRNKVHSGPLGTEGSYRQRLYLMQKLFKECAVELPVRRAARAVKTRSKLEKLRAASLSERAPRHSGLAFAR